mmetsp:Transcript_49445/g.96694  ORF Transcript_49445/g.96694 Transcript_49445/m.96694 type:complete len:200 (-) Transcript_49445:36-635(-)
MTHGSFPICGFASSPSMRYARRRNRPLGVGNAVSAMKDAGISSSTNVASPSSPGAWNASERTAAAASRSGSDGISGGSGADDASRLPPRRVLHTARPPTPPRRPQVPRGWGRPRPASLETRALVPPRASVSAHASRGAAPERPGRRRGRGHGRSTVPGRGDGATAGGRSGKDAIVVVFMVDDEYRVTIQVTFRNSIGYE